MDNLIDFKKKWLEKSEQKASCLSDAERAKKQFAVALEGKNKRPHPLPRRRGQSLEDIKKLAKAMVKLG